jgi:Ca2+-binding RTX toxin-like protein
VPSLSRISIRYIGTESDDLIIGNGVDNVFYGGLGDDTLDGAYGGFNTAAYIDSEFSGTVNLADAAGISSNGDVDSYLNIHGGLGSNFDDILIGSADANRLLGAGGDDLISGGDGDDTIEGGMGADTVDGGNGFDIISYHYSETNLIFDFTSTTENTDDAAGDVISGLEGVIGTDFDDHITGDDTANHISSGIGTDTIFAGAGDDTVTSRYPSFESRRLDEVYGGEGNDSLEYGNMLDGGEGDDYLYHGNEAYGGIGNDTIYDSLYVEGGSGDDNIQSRFGNATVFGGEGNDTIGGGFEVYGGAGDDLIQYVRGLPSETTTINAGDGDDFIYDWYGSTDITAGVGNDRVIVDSLHSGRSDIDTVDLGDGDDIIGFNLVHPNLSSGSAINADAGDGYDIARINFLPYYNVTGEFEVVDFRVLEQGGSTEVRSGTISGFEEVHFRGTNMLREVHFGDGDDIFFGERSTELIVDGGAGDDLLYSATGGLCTVLGGDGQDTLVAHGTSPGQFQELHGGAGDDILVTAEYLLVFLALEPIYMAAKAQTHLF